MTEKLDKLMTVIVKQQTELLSAIEEQQTDCFNQSKFLKFINFSFLISSSPLE